LARYLAATNINELKNSGSFKKLMEFVHESFKIHWKDGNLERIKELDSITKNINIPSRSGLNIATLLIVSIDLL